MTLDLVAIAAHPDDAEISAGGTLLRMAAAGRRVGIVDLTRGEMGTRGTAQDRAAETERASALLGLAARRNLGLPDGRIECTVATREALARVLRELAPTIVVAHHEEDLHPDHAAAGKLSREAWYLSGLARLAELDGGSPAAPAVRARRFWRFMSHVPFDPTFVVDIAPVWEQKLALVRCYASQLRPEGPEDRGRHLLFGADILRRMETRARFFGERAGITHGEGFLSLGPLVCGDPSRWF